METEKDLIAGARQFDEDVLSVIYDRYSPGIYRYAFRILGDQGEAEECVSETFKRFLNALSNRGGPKDHLQAYLYRIAHNWINDLFRRESPPMLPLAPARLSQLTDNPHTIVQENIEIESVRRALRLLTPDQRLVIMLKFHEGMTNKDVAKILNKPVTAVKSLQHRGLEALRRILNAYGNEHELRR